MDIEIFLYRFYANEFNKNITIKSTECKNAKSQIEYICNECGYNGLKQASSLIYGKGCPMCSRQKSNLKRRKSNEQFISDMQILHPNISILSDYNGNHNSVQCKCKICGHTWNGSPANLYSKHGCKRCGHQRMGEFNTKPNITIAEEMPYAIEYFVDKTLPYKYGSYSRKVAEFCCPICKNTETNAIVNVLHRHTMCTICSDKYSMPNKTIRLLLSQLNVEAKFEYIAECIKPLRFDAYFEIDGQKYAVEMDGGVGHGNKKYKSVEKDTEGKQRDKIKDQKCIENNIQMIRIDCNYKSGDSFEYIKQGILKSCLANIVDLSIVDWFSIEKNIKTHSIMHDIVTDYNSGITNIKELSKRYNINPSTARRYLYSGNKLGLCNYVSNPYNKKNIVVYSKSNIVIGRFTSYKSCISFFKKQAINIGKNSISKYINTGNCYKGLYFYNTEQNFNQDISA